MSTFKELNISNPGTSSKYGGDDTDLLNKLFNGVTSGIPPVKIKTSNKFGFWDGTAYFRNQADTKNTTIRGQLNSPVTDVDLRLPPITGNDVLSSLNLAQVWLQKQQFNLGLLLQEMDEPVNPDPTSHFIYLDNITGHLTRKTSSGTIVDYDTIGGGGSSGAKNVWYAIVEKSGTTYIATKSDGTLITSGTNARTVINAACVAASAAGGGKVRLKGNATYGPMVLSLTVSSNVILEGEGYSTILDFTGLPAATISVNLSAGACMRRLKIQGNISTLPAALSTGRVNTSGDNTIEDVFITDMGYGIDCSGAPNIRIRNLRCENIKDANDWASCFHVSDDGSNVKLDGFYFKNCNRGCECEDGADNVLVQNGYLENIQNFNASGNAAFTVDVHVHDGGGLTENIHYQNIYMKHCAYGINAGHSGTGYADADIPRNVSFKNITIDDPQGFGFFVCQDLEIENVRIINSTLLTGAIFPIGKKSKQVRIKECEMQVRGSQAAFQTVDASVFDVVIRNNRMIYDTTVGTTAYYGIDILLGKKITVEDNSLENTRGFGAIHVGVGASDVRVLRNYVNYAPVTPANYGIWCEGTACTVEGNRMDDVNGLPGILHIVFRDGALRCDCSRNVIPSSYIWARTTSSYINIHDNIIAPGIVGVIAEEPPNNITIRNNINFSPSRENYATISKLGTQYLGQRHDGVILSSGTFKVVIDAVMAACSTAGGGTIRLAGATTYGTVTTIINIPNDVSLEGDGWTTIILYNLANNVTAMNLGARSRLKNLKIMGNIATLPATLGSHKINTNDDVVVDNVWLTDMGYGFANDGKNHVRFKNVRIENIKDANDWACAIHQSQSTDISVEGFWFKNCNRGLETEHASNNCHFQSGYMENIRNFNATGNAAFSIDVHNHDAEGITSNITYKDIYLKNCQYGPNCSHSGSGYADVDMPRHVSFENITIDNVDGFAFISGWNISFKRCKFLNNAMTTGAFFAIGKNSKHIRIEENEVEEKHGTSVFVQTVDAAVEDVLIRKNRYRDNADVPSTGHYGIVASLGKNITIEENVCELARGFSAIMVNDTTSRVRVIGNHITYPGAALLNYAIWCEGADCVVESNKFDITLAGPTTAHIVFRDGAIRCDCSKNMIPSSYIWIRNTATYINLHDNIFAPSITGFLIEATATELKIRNNINFRSENGGLATFSGNAATKTFNIPHGLSLAPISVLGNGGHVFAISNADDSNGVLIVTYDVTNIIVTYASAPPTGTNNLKYLWRAQV